MKLKRSGNGNRERLASLNVSARPRHCRYFPRIADLERECSQ